MRMRTLGHLWPVSALTLGGGGIGQVWGQTTRDEAIATVHAAIDAGITLIGVAPTYGDGEAERVVGEAFSGRLPPGVRVVTKHLLGNPPATEVPARLERSLDASLERMHLSFVDLFVLHGYMVNTDDDAADDRFSTELDLQTRVMAAVCIASIVAMTLVAIGYPAGGVVSAGLGISGIVGAVAMVGGGGDDVSARFLPAVLAVSLSA